nr:DUF4446 family protein [Tissierella sp.]
MEYIFIIKEFIEDYTAEFVGFLYLGFLILAVALLISNHRNRKLLEKYNRMVKGIDVENFEELLQYLQNHVNDLNANVNTLKLEAQEVQERLDFTIQHVGFIRYNAFNDMGSEMSYSIALLDSFQNGLVLTGIYGRDQTVTYAKDIKAGTSFKTLSAEEIMAVDRAIRGTIRKV